MAIWRAALAGLMLCATPSRALVALSESEADVEVASSRAVLASHDTGSTLWVELELRAVGDKLVLLLPLNDGALLDPGDPDWFAAVEAASAPRVVPEVGTPTPPCADPTRVESTVSEPSGETAEPDAVELLSDHAAVSQFIESEALRAAPEQLSSFANHGGAFVALSYTVSGGAPLLIGLRLQDALLPERLLEWLSPLAWRRPLALTLTTLASDALMVAAEQPLASHELSPTWYFDRGQSDYVERRAEALRKDPGHVWLTEVVGQTPLFEHYVIDDQTELPSLPSDFGRRLEARGHACPAFDMLGDREGRERAHAAVSCAQGSLARIGEPRCRANEDEMAWVLECDGVQDLGLAFSGAEIGKVTLVRQLGMLPGRARLQPFATEVRQARLTALVSSGGECAVAVGTGSGGTPADSVSTPGTGASTGHAAPEPAPDIVVGVYAEGCSSGADTQSGCASSSSQGAEDETCSGSSSSDYEGDETCSGDSAPGHDGGSSSCSGEPSSEAPAGETCASDGSADVEGDTCSGGAGAEGECALRPRSLPRPRPSVLTVAAAALLLPWRRRTSRRRRVARGRGA